MKTNPVTSLIETIATNNLEDFLESMHDGSPPNVAIEIAKQGEFIERCGKSVKKRDVP
jgi:hypothetical protein